jgi:hypothetical protein
MDQSSREATTISLSTAVTPGTGLGRAQGYLQRRDRRDVAGEMRCAVVHPDPDRAGVEIGRSRDRLLHAMLDVGGGRLGLRLDLDQVVDDAHPRELADCALGGVSLRCRLDVSMQDHAPVTDLRRDRVRDLCSPAP